MGRAADQLDQISYDGGKQMRAGDQSRLAGQTQNLNKELSDQETENWTQVSVVIIKDDTGIENACDCLLYVYVLISKVLGVKNQVGVRVSTEKFCQMKYTTETVCQCNSSETTRQNFVELCCYDSEGHTV